MMELMPWHTILAFCSIGLAAVVIFGRALRKNSPERIKSRRDAEAEADNLARSGDYFFHESQFRNGADQAATGDQLSAMGGSQFPLTSSGSGTGLPIAAVAESEL